MEQKALLQRTVMAVLVMLSILPLRAQVPEGYPYGPMLKEGYTWYYWLDDETDHYSHLPGYTLSFKGRSVVDGHECVNCYVNEDYDGTPVAQMYVDEANRIWAYINAEVYSKKISPYILSLIFDGYYDEAVLIFDPNDMKSFFETNWEKYYCYQYVSCDEVEIEGAVRKRYILGQEPSFNVGSTAYYVDGIGIDGRYGNFIIMFPLCPTKMYWRHTIGLDRVTNPDGEIIYKGSLYHVEGDLNWDGVVDVGDVDDMLYIVLGGPHDFARWHDLNGDGLIDVTDLTLLLDIVLGNASGGNE